MDPTFTPIPVVTGTPIPMVTPDPYNVPDTIMINVTLPDTFLIEVALILFAVTAIVALWKWIKRIAL